MLLLNTGAEWFCKVYKKNLHCMQATPIWGRLSFGNFKRAYMYPLMIVEIHTHDLPFANFNNIFTIDLQKDPYLGLSKIL